MERSRILASWPLLVLMGIPLNADLVPISIFQQVSVSGDANACGYSCQVLWDGPPNWPGSNYSPPAQTNTQLPPKDLTSSGGVTDNVLLQPGGEYSWVSSVSSGAIASQSSNVTSGNILLSLNTSSQFITNSYHITASTVTNSQYSLVFDLTTPSVVHLTGGLDWEADEGYQVGHPWGSRNLEIHLTGPGFQFDQVIPPVTDPSGYDPTEPYLSFFDDSYVLNPGTYTLNAVSGFNVGQGDFSSTYLTADVSLNADFNNIPEPARISVALGAVMLVGILLSHTSTLRTAIARHHSS